MLSIAIKNQRPALLLSVIIPVYNKIDIIGPCIMKNITHCTLPAEWIIIDNNSDAPTKEGLRHIKAFAENMGHIFIIVEETENTGVARAWNKGLSIALCENICILNNDCILMPEWDSIALKEIEKGVLDIFSPFILEPPMFSKPYGENNFLNGNKNWLYYLKRNKGRYREGIFGGVVFIGKKRYFDATGSIDEQYWLSMEDIDFLYRAMIKEINTGVTGNIVGFHHVSATRKTVKMNEAANQNHFKDKWGWDFEKEQKKIGNKMTRSYGKKLFKYFGVMNTMRQTFDRKGFSNKQ